MKDLPTREAAQARLDDIAMDRVDVYNDTREMTLLLARARGDLQTREEFIASLNYEAVGRYMAKHKVPFNTRVAEGIIKAALGVFDG